MVAETECISLFHQLEQFPFESTALYSISNYGFLHLPGLGRGSRSPYMECRKMDPEMLWS